MLYNTERREHQIAEQNVEVIETTAGQIADVISRLGVPAGRMITVIIGPDDWLAKARRESRRLVIAAGLSDEDIDKLIKRTRQEVEPHLA